MELATENAGGWGAQAVDLSPAQGAVVEMEFYEAGLYSIVPSNQRAQIEAFAERIGRHPSIVVGRMQHDEVITYGQHRWAHTPIRSYLSDWTDRLPKAAQPICRARQGPFLCQLSQCQTASPIISFAGQANRCSRQ